MKTNKQNGTQNRRICAIALIAIIAIAMATALIGCKGDDDPPPPQDLPKEQTATITGLFDGTYSATVRGYLTDTEWNGVADKIKNGLNARYASSTTSQQNNLFKPMFSLNSMVITVEKDPDPPYISYSATYNSDSFSINYAILNVSETLQVALYDALRVCGGATSVPETDWTD